MYDERLRGVKHAVQAVALRSGEYLLSRHVGHEADPGLRGVAAGQPYVAFRHLHCEVGPEGVYVMQFPQSEGSEPFGLRFEVPAVLPPFGYRVAALPYPDRREDAVPQRFEGFAVRKGREYLLRP